MFSPEREGGGGLKMGFVVKWSDGGAAGGLKRGVVVLVVEGRVWVGELGRRSSRSLSKSDGSAADWLGL